MIRCRCSKKPRNFHRLVERPGKRWLAAHPRGRPRDLWSRYKSELAVSFRGLCAYGAMHEPVGTVDHFVSLSEDRQRAYDWTNYRFCSAWLNSSKQHLRSTELLDPYLVRDGWFELLLPSLQLVVTEAMPRRHRAQATLMLTRLHLRDGEHVMRQRRRWLRLYEERKISLRGLAEMAPLLAAAIRKREREHQRRRRRSRAGGKPRRLRSI
jgi:hypothetical protein